MRVLSIILAVGVYFTVWAESFQRTPDGCLNANGVKFGLTLCKNDWTTVDQEREDVVSFLGEGGQNSSEGIRRDGTFRLTSENTFQLTEIIENRSDNEMRIQYILSSDKPGPVELFTYQTYLDFDSYQKRPILLDGIPVVMGGKSQVSTEGKIVQIPQKNGILEIKGAKRQVILTVADGKVRMRLVFGYKGWRKAHLDLVFRFIPYELKSVDMDSVMNMGFKDHLANDRKGGWTDQGPDNDLSMMKSGMQKMDGIPFKITDPAKNSGKSCLAIRGAARPYFAETAKVQVPNISGQTLFLLNALAWAPPEGTTAGKVVIYYSDGEKKSVMLKCGTDTGNFWNPRELKNAHVVWNAQNGEASIGLYATRIPLAEKPVRTLEFVSENQVWMILAATIGTAEETAQEEKSVTMTPNQDWIPLVWQFAVEKGSVTDLSFLMDAPAGKHGFLKINGDHFEFEKQPGKAVRFWGCNIAERAHWYENEQDTLMMLDDIASRGYNILRFHHFDWGLTSRSGSSDQIIPEVLNKMDFLFAEAKKRGLYITLDLFTIRWPKIPKYKQLNPSDYKLFCYFDKEVRQDLIRLSKELLGHRNPYTGLTWAEDPALAMINLINEGTLSINAYRASERCKPIIDAAFAKYLKERNLTVSEENRNRYFDEFLTFSGKEFFDDLKRELGSIGVRIPLCDQNFGIPTSGTREHYDYVDTHFYWSHPTYIGKKMWALPSYTSAASPIAANAGGVKDIFFSRISGKPMVISEWNFCYPNPHFFEGAFLTAGYAALQGYSGLMQFCYAGGEQKNVSHQIPLGSFLLSNNPLHALSSRAGALLFLRGDVSPAKEELLVTENSASTLGAQLPLVMRCALLSKLGSSKAPVIITQNETLKEKGCKQIVRTANETFFPTVRQAVGLKQEPFLPDGTVVSATGELRLNSKTQLFQIITSRSEAILLAKEKQSEGRFLCVANGNTAAAVYAGSLDAKALPESGRILLLHLTDLKNDGAVFADSSMTILKDSGKETLLLRKNQVKVELAYRHPCDLYACEISGKRLWKIPVKNKAGKISFTMNNFVNGKAILLYELVRK